MRIYSTLAAVTVSFAALNFPSIASAADAYSVNVWNVDDNATVTLSNSNYADENILSLDFSQSGSADITNLLVEGNNFITFNLYNYSAGYTISYNISKNGSVIYNYSCGSFNIYGCNSDSYQTGLVLSNSYNLNISPSSSDIAASVPEIDGSKLPIAGFTLGTFMLWMVARRCREQQDSLGSTSFA